jgi:hypothetical protein
MHGDVKFCGYNDTNYPPGVSSSEHEALKARVKQLESALGIPSPPEPKHSSHLNIKGVENLLKVVYTEKLVASVNEEKCP